MLKTIFVDRQAGRGDMGAHGGVSCDLIAVADGGGYDFGRYLGEDWRLPISLVATYTSSKLDGDVSSTDPESIFSGGKDGNDVPYIPTWQFHFSVALEHKGAGFYLDATYLDRTYTSASNVTNLTNPAGTPDARFGQTDSAILLDLTARYPIIEDLVLFAGIKNALNQTYITSRHPAGARSGRPRNYQAGLEWRF